MHVIELSGVSKRFGSVKALDNLSLCLSRGGIMGFLGANGAGKTTTIKLLLGFSAPDEGEVKVLGGDPCHTAIRARVGFMPEAAYYYRFLNVRELLRFYGGLSRMRDRMIEQRSRELIELVGLASAAERPLRTYSKGMLQRAGIAQALLHDPDLLILDEPFTGLDPLARIQLRDLITGLRDQGKSVFLSSHELSEAELICDSVAIIRGGRMVMNGAISELVGDGGDNLERIFLRVLEEGRGEDLSQRHREHGGGGKQGSGLSGRSGEEGL